jgi:hypothetical protein
MLTIAEIFLIIQIHFTNTYINIITQTLLSFYYNNYTLRRSKCSYNQFKL